MGDPRMLAYVLAALMLSVALYCAGRFVFSLASRRATQRETDAVHTLMGASMAGMLTPTLAFVPSGLWVLVFSATTLWFGWHVVRESDRESVGSHAGFEHLPHLLMSAAMIYMLIVAEWTGSMGTHRGSAMPHMSAAAMGAARWPLLTIVIAGLLLGDGALTFGRNLRQMALQAPGRQLAMAATGEPAQRPGGLSDESPVRRNVRQDHSGAPDLLAPRSVMVCQLVMSLVMGYMLLSLL
jgi:hypothetical protein